MMKKISVFDLTLISLFAALLLAVQVGFAFLPNVELVSILVIVFTMILKRKIIYVLAVFVLGEGLIYGFGTWWFCYLYVWGILALIAYIFRKKREPLFWALVSGAFGLLFGTLCSFVYLFVLGFAGMISWIVSGLIYDVIHGVSNFVIALILFKPLMSAADMLMKKFGHQDYMNG